MILQYLELFINHNFLGFHMEKKKNVITNFHCKCHKISATKYEVHNKLLDLTAQYQVDKMSQPGNYKKGSTRNNCMRKADFR